jgi:transposase
MEESKEIWCALHEKAFAYLGGVTKTIRLDNWREGVIDPDIYDPELNPLYADLLKHYGVVAIPCRPYARDLKGAVSYCTTWRFWVIAGFSCRSRSASAMRKGHGA